jgi:hypothetical protein
MYRRPAKHIPYKNIFTMPWLFHYPHTPPPLLLQHDKNRSHVSGYANSTRTKKRRETNPPLVDKLSRRNYYELAVPPPMGNTSILLALSVTTAPVPLLLSDVFIKSRPLRAPLIVFI